MSRGITSFSDFIKEHTAGGTRYRCAYALCRFYVMRRSGNALAGHSKAVAAIKRHVEAIHVPTGEATP